LRLGISQTDKILKKRILIVGGTGFIGSNLLRISLDAGYQCSVLSRRELTSHDRLENVDYLSSDLNDIKSLRNSLANKKFEYVINLSGYIDHKLFSAGGSSIIKSHLLGLINLIEVIDRDALQTFVQIGTSDEYGDLTHAQKETYRESPISPYSFSRLASTHLIQMLNKTEGFPGVVLRLFLVYGEGQKEDRFIPYIVKSCLRGEKFPVSFAKQYRDFCHVSDICHGILSSLSNTKALGEVINLGSGNPILVKDVIEKIVYIVGSGEPLYGKVSYRIGESMCLYPDTEKAKLILSWKPEVSLNDGLANLIEIFKGK